MINRTVCLFARGEATSPSSESDFERNLQSPQIMERVKDFRLFTCLTAFCKMALRNCPWLRPDMSFAKKLWAEWDRILAEEYGMPRPEPRRNERRANICETQALMEAVARVYLFKQVSHADLRLAILPHSHVSRVRVFCGRRRSTTRRESL